MQVMRIERATRAIWPQVAAGDLFAIDRLVKLMERQAKLLGLDAPTQVSITEDTKASLTTVLADLEKVLIAGEVVPDEPNRRAVESGRDQGPDHAGPDRREGGFDPGGGVADDLAAIPEGIVGALPLADPPVVHPDDGHVDDARGPRNGQD